MLAGDFNLPDIDWTIPTIKNQCRTPAIHSQLLNTLADHSLTQLNQTATHENNILDLITTNSPNLVNRIEILPGISDHHAIFTEVNTISDYAFSWQKNNADPSSFTTEQIHTDSNNTSRHLQTDSSTHSRQQPWVRCGMPSELPSMRACKHMYPENTSNLMTNYHG